MADSTQMLFAYGTLRDADMRKALFKAVIPDVPATLQGFALKESGDYYFITEEAGRKVDGVLIGLSEAQILLADQWEEIPAYGRIRVVVEAAGQQVEAWAYAKPIQDGRLVHAFNASALDRGLVHQQIEAFHAQLAMNRLPYCDLYLMVPCLVEARPLLPPYNPEGKRFEAGYIRRMQKICDGEFAGLLVSRTSLPMAEIAAYSADDASLLGYEKAALIITTFGTGSYATVCIAIPAVSVPLLDLLDQVSSRRLRIRSLDENDFKGIEEHLSRHGLRVNGIPRATVFFREKPAERELMSTLLCEAGSTELLSGKACREPATENIALYSTAEIYASERCVAEIPQQFACWHEERLDRQLLTLFIVELLQLQESALNKVSSDVYAMILQKSFQGDIKAWTQIEHVTEEYSNAMLLWDIHAFKYRTAQLLANELARKFEMPRKFDEFFQSKDLVEQLTQLHSSSLNIADNKALNCILLLLAFIQVAPVLYTIIRTLFSAELHTLDILSASGSLASCVMIWAAFRVLNRRQGFASQTRRTSLRS